MLSRRGEEIVINSAEITSYFNDAKYEGFVISWDSNIGFGELTFSKDKENKLEVQTETMCDNNDRRFMYLVIDKLLEDFHETSIVTPEVYRSCLKMLFSALIENCDVIE